MQTNTVYIEEKIKKSLSQKGFSEEEITNIIQWYKDMQKGNLITEEEAYANIYKEKAVHHV